MHVIEWSIHSFSIQPCFIIYKCKQMTGKTYFLEMLLEIYSFKNVMIRYQTEKNNNVFAAVGLKNFITK